MVDLEELRRLTAEATPGPWAVETDGIYNATRSYLVLPVGESEQDDSDAALIAAARNALPALLDRMEKLERVAEAARTVAENQADDIDIRLRYVVVQPDRDEWLALADALAALDDEEGAGSDG